MPDFGNKSYYWTQSSGASSYNVISELREMPRNGWIRSVSVRAAGKDQNVTARLAVWDQDGGDKLLWSGGSQNWNPTLQWRTETIAEPIAIRGGRDLRIGFWTPYGASRQWGTGMQWIPLHSRQIYRAKNAPPDPWSTDDVGFGDLSAYITYIANERPNKGSWVGTTPSGAGGGLTPRLEGTITHSAEEQGLDYTERVEIIYQRVGSTRAYTYSFEPTQKERDAGRFSRAEISFDLGQTYRIWFRHRDSWGTWAEWSNVREFVAENAPSAPTITSPLGKIHPPSGFNYSGTYSHPTGLAGNAVQIQIYNQRGTAKIYDSGTVAVSVANGGTWSIPEFHGSLDLSTRFKVRARLRDTSNSWGAFSGFFGFKTNFVPHAPTNLLPRGGRETSSRVLRASVLDPDGDLITAAETELRNANTGALIFNSPTWIAGTNYAGSSYTRPTTANGHRYVSQNAGKSGPNEPAWPLTGTVRDNAGLVTVARSTSYAFRSAVLKPNGTTGDAQWYECTTGGTTAATAPAYPSTGQVTDGTAIFTARDTIVWAEAGSDTVTPMTISANGRRATRTATELIADVNYEWRVRASDGLNWGPYSLWQRFTYAVIPEITAIAPSESGQRNLIQDPSASGVSSFWTERNRTSANYINRVLDGNAAFGDACWEAVETANSSNALVSDLITVDPTLPVLLQAHVKKISGTTKTHLYLECYDNTSTLIDTVYPGQNFLNGTDVDGDWAGSYGGMAWPAGSANAPALPAGTTQVRAVIEPSRASAATVRFDALDFRQLDMVPSISDWNNYGLHWYGFLDGSIQAALETGDDYYWRGTPGDSVSEGINIFTDLSGAVIINYYSEASAVKADDRLLIERYGADGTWLPAYDTGWTGAGGTRTAIPFPAGVLKNEGRFRVTAFAKDSVGKIGSTAPIEFDVRFVGPPELDILGLLPNPERGEITILIEQSTIDPESFGGIEFLRQTSLGTVTLDIVTDQETTEYTDPFPVSDEETTYLVRQRENITGQQIESRTTRMTGTVSYDRNFLKSVEDPYATVIRFKSFIATLPSDQGEGEGATFTPWGSKTPVHFAPEAIYESGSFTVRVSEEEDGNTNERHAALKALWRERPVCALLSVYPSEKRFVYLNSFGRSFGHYIDDIDVGWEETGWPEDYYLRQADERTSSSVPHTH